MGILANKVAIISIGDELLIGQIVNTNASWMAEILNQNGFNTVGIYTVGDSSDAIKNILKITAEEANLILITGGLGPTKDDITKQAVCDFFNSKLVINQEVLNHVTEFFAKRGRELTELNRQQALVPHNCHPIFNPVGTAPGMYFHYKEKHFVFMPGVPFEMKNIMENWVIPQMQKQLNTQTIFQKTILTHGMGESFLAELIEPWEDNLPEHISLAYLPSPGKVRLRLRAIGDNIETLKSEINTEINNLTQRIPELIYGFDDDSLEAIVGDLLRKNKLSLCTAESCTGGYLAHRITEIPGSSEYFLGSIISYSNESKINHLDVKKETIETYGAVSEQTATEMAKNVMKKFGADYALAVSGIAGPSGGTIEKPVGTVYISLASKTVNITKRFQFGDHRLRNINMTTQAALNLLRLELIK